MRLLKATFPWLLLSGALALLAINWGSAYLAFASAGLAFVILVLYGLGIMHSDREQRSIRDFEATCGQWTCRYCGQVYGTASVFQPYVPSADPRDKWANVWCAHCDRLNVYAKNGTWLYGNDEPMPEMCQTLRAGKEADRKDGSRVHPFHA